MGSDLVAALAIAPVTWSVAFILAVATALLSRDVRQRADARKVMEFLLRLRRR